MAITPAYMLVIIPFRWSACVGVWPFERPFCDYFLNKAAVPLVIGSVSIFWRLNRSQFLIERKLAGIFFFFFFLKRSAAGCINRRELGSRFFLWRILNVECSRNKFSTLRRRPWSGAGANWGFHLVHDTHGDRWLGGVGRKNGVFGKEIFIF